MAVSMKYPYPAVISIQLIIAMPEYPATAGKVSVWLRISILNRELVFISGWRIP